MVLDQVLSLGCLYLEFRDATHEGDGLHVVRCYRYLLPMFKYWKKELCHRHINTIAAAFDMLPEHSKEVNWYAVDLSTQVANWLPLDTVSISVLY